MSVSEHFLVEGIENLSPMSWRGFGDHHLFGRQMRERSTNSGGIHVGKDDDFGVCNGAKIGEKHQQVSTTTDGQRCFCISKCSIRQTYNLVIPNNLERSVNCLGQIVSAE